MDLYDRASKATATLFMQRYSTSFGLASRLFPATNRQHIYDIYGLVRIADEIVDTYTGSDQRQRLDELEHEVDRAITTGYSSNPIVQAFQITARQCEIDKTLYGPFFDSMRLDCQPQSYDDKLYKQYIYGSAEVIGLMCLKTFGDKSTYDQLQSGARHLGAAFQKVNFLRDIADDYHQRHRYYFPIASFETFDDKSKHTIVKDVEYDLRQAYTAIKQLPPQFRPAILTAYDYFGLLLKKIDITPASDIKQQRIRIKDSTKLLLLARRIATKR